MSDAQPGPAAPAAPGTPEAGGSTEPGGWAAATGLRPTLSTGRVVFLVVAAAAPMAAMVGNLPLALYLGNGAGTPGAFLLATLILLGFAVGYATMGERVVNTGAFYTYVARGLGKPPAVGAAYLAVLAYNAMTVALAGAVGYFVDIVLDTEGIHGPWQLYSAIAIAAMAILGYRSVDASAKVLAVLMAAEIGILVIFDLGVVGHRGGHALPVTSFAPGTVFSGAVGLALMFGFTSFLGFESAALYAEETQDPRRSIPRAIYFSLLIVGGFYVLTSWVVVGAIGPAAVRSTARSELGMLLFTLNTRYVTAWVTDVMAVFLCTSVFASMLALHNAAARYMFALGRERLLPRALGQLHPRRYAPSNASATQTVITVLVVGAFAVAGLDPYLNLGTSMAGLGTLGVVALQAAAAVSIVAYFRRRGDRRWWRTTIAPGLGGIGLTTATVLVVNQFDTLTGTTALAVRLLPWLLVVVALGGTGYGLWLRRARPRLYADLAPAELRAETVRTAAVVAAYSRRYCVIGAGPAGLIMARALRAEGIGFDHFERHTDVGGIWDIDRPGTPMYESAHFISSKYRSGFYGFPMPASYPDYPSHRQILSYVRDFARAYGLYDGLSLGVGVERVSPVDGGKWTVRLSTGESRTYDGVVCANGVNWLPRAPSLPGADVFRGEIRHSMTYRSPDEFRGRRVLIVGCGNSGADIACDAARTADAAFLSVRRGYRFVPKHLFGIPTDVFIDERLTPPAGIVVPEDASALLDGLVGDLTRYGLPAPDHAALTSHPILNTQVLHYLAHGDLSARGDVASLTPDGVRFVDGRTETVDLVLLATGYEHAIPYLTLDPGDLYLNIFHRTLDGLYVLGFVEFADAAYQRFDEMAHMIVADMHARETGAHWDLLRSLRREAHPDLRGGIPYVDSPRHADYVETHAYQAALAELRDTLGWPAPSAASYPRPSTVDEPAPAPAG
jgi:amino acid transporter